MIRPSRRLLASLSAVIALAGCGALALPISTAQAALITLGACNTSALSQPFAPWLDPASYELAPGGDFEGSQWTLAGGAGIVAGSEPYAATGTLGASALSLPAGSSAESPLTCVDAAYPSARLFIEGTGSVAVSFVYGDLDIPGGVALAVGDWAPTPIMVTTSAVLAALSGGTAQVSVRITALTGNPVIDDVFVDPWNRG